MTGPCTPYNDPESLWTNERLCFGDNPTDQQKADIATCVGRSSAALYHLLGMQYPGTCTATVRPVRQNGSCWDRFDHVGLGMRHHDRDAYVIPLHNPVIAVTAVKIDGDPFTDFHVQNSYELVRDDGDGWPAHQQLALADTQVGSFSVAYAFGAPTPDDVVAADAEYAIHLYLNDHPKGRRLDDGVTSATRQGTSVSRQRDIDTARQAGPALPLVMAALAAHNPKNQLAPSWSWSPPAWELIVVNQRGPQTIPTP